MQSERSNHACVQPQARGGRKRFLRFWLILLGLFPVISVLAEDLNEQLWSAARQGNVETIRALLAKGVDVNAKTPRYSATALSFAVDHQRVEAVKFLLEKGADPNIKDTFYNASPLGWASYKNNIEIIRLLLQHGAEGREEILLEIAAEGKPEIAAILLEKPGIKPEALSEALQIATRAGQSGMVELLKKAGATLPEVPSVDKSILATYAGSYKNPEGNELKIDLKEDGLTLQSIGQEPFLLSPIDQDTFRPATITGFTITFNKHQNDITGFTVNRQDGSSTVYTRFDPSTTAQPPAVAAPAVPSPAVPPPESSDVKLQKTSSDWPSFRGRGASGIGDGLNPPAKWDAAKSVNIRWKTPIPGLAHSSPVIWEDRVFITTAVSSDPNAALRHGLYGDVEPDKDMSKHTWIVYCLDKTTGKILWQRTAQETAPNVKRHPKSSQANATPVTDGKRLLVLLGSGDLLSYDLKGDLLWKKQLGVLDSGWFFDPEYQWGFGSSPIIYKDLVIVQADLQKNSFIAAYQLKDGKQAWLTKRDEIPSWGTPTLYQGKRAELITNGTNAIRGYDPDTGKELWKLSGNSEITVPTPIIANDLIYVTAGYAPIQPIYAIRAGATGDITLPKDTEKNQWVVWSKQRGGPYMPTPIVYGGYLYTLANNGVVTCYNALTGEKIYQQRLGGKGSAYAFTASPVAADGKLYFASEDGEIFVVKAGPTFEIISTNPMGEVCMATPAISNRMLIVRTQHHVYGIAEPQQATSK